MAKEESDDVVEMKSGKPSCAILADRHTRLAEGVRDMLETAFQTVYTVADSETLREGASQLLPSLIVLDLALAGGDSQRLLHDIKERSPSTLVLVLTVHDERVVAELALHAGASGVMLKRCIAQEFMPAVDAVLHGEKYISPDIGVAV